jgi:acetolactate synthase I/II/III large subunit
MDVARLTAEILKERGVRYVFGIPGGPSIPYMEAWREAGIEFILTSHEASAGIMACVTSRATGTPGVCHATFGPGAVNLASGAGCALLDRAPLIAFTTEVPDAMLHRTTQMGIDHQSLFKSVAKATYRLRPDNAGEILHAAFETATGELPGSVHIGLPSDISGMAAAGSRTTQTTEKSLASNTCETSHTSQSTRNSQETHDNHNHHILHTTPNNTSIENTLVNRNIENAQGDIDELTALLRSARRPLIAVGLTAIRRGAGAALLRFLEKTPMPVVVTPMARGIIADTHPCFAGVLFHALSDRLRPLIAQSDLIIGIGYDQVEYNYESWIPDAPIIHFATIATDLPEGTVVKSFLGEPGHWFKLLADSATEGDFLAGRGVESVRKEIADVFEECASRWGPVSALGILSDSLPSDAILTCDVGSHLHLAGQFWPAKEPEQLIMTNGWSTMGFGIPSALAMKLNRPGTTVVCLTGDGGFLMSAGEMMTARRYNLNIIVVVISDRELNLIRVKQSWKNLAPYATKLTDGDLFGADRFLGVKVFEATDTLTMEQSIAAALALNEPAIINVIVSGDDYNKLVVRQ